MFSDDVEIGEGCPKCGDMTYWRHCNDCEDGFIDEYEDDAINFAPGEAYSRCSTCRGRAYFEWCINENCDWYLGMPKTEVESGRNCESFRNTDTNQEA